MNKATSTKPEAKPGEAPRSRGLGRAEQRQVQEQTRASARVVYQTVRTEGENELQRPMASLWWSGVAAGIAISSSVLVQGCLQTYLPDTIWRPLIVKLGYCVGFLIAVLGRMQLFTENTITVVLPVLADRKARSLWLMVRLWVIVLCANLLGTAAAALMASHTQLATPEQLASFNALAQPLLELDVWQILVRSIPAGFFIAAMVWMMAAAHSGEFLIVAMMSYIIALGGFPHVIAGSTEVFLLIFDGDLGLQHGCFGIIAPILVGNTLGGTGLFALLAYGQVKGEI